MQVMVDLETMGTRHDAPVLAIGAVLFDPVTGDLGQTFYQGVDIADAFRFGKPDGDTLKWWLGQGDDARGALLKGVTPIARALENFADFYKLSAAGEIWGNGATFDVTILEAAFHAVLARKAPWSFRAIRDVRTIAALGGDLVPEMERTGTAHNALDDATNQARWVSAMWRALRPAPATGAVPQ